ncbi:hypothetical protein [Micromonospora sp. WMMD812]|uniref:hypothetical protein n=1 Tax=Micromonospora sp. WMMD812 TaxID=3015152 RepID=UPI00248B5958|nr:hypothetical protein [Micromonospora sp. WMMD812]WBB69999.1 hypothetical protein O7603_11825 [Micromonospora sp. WMMD812]
MGQSDDVAVHGYPARRLDIRVDRPFAQFRGEYERAVPPYDKEAFDALVARQAPWSDVLDLMRERAPHGFLIYWSSDDVQPMMRLAGDSAHCVEYLMGNHTIAERMFRHDPAAMLYAPLRTTISADAAGGGTRFTIEQPSCPMSSFGQPGITEVGLDLDREVADLLAYLGVAVPEQLRCGQT